MHVFKPDRFKNAVQSAGLTDKDVALLAGVTPGAVRNWMNGHSRPGKQRMRNLSELGLLLDRMVLIQESAKKLAPPKRQPYPGIGFGYRDSNKLWRLTMYEDSGTKNTIAWDKRWYEGFLVSAYPRQSYGLA
jgi:transcriptional regulator with XRE-family HTH domain